MTDTLTPPDTGPAASSTMFPVQTNPWRSEPAKSQFLDAVQNFLAQIDLDGTLPGGAEAGSFGVRATATGASGPTTQWKRFMVGRIDSDGTINFGTGFSVAHPSTGTFTVTFDTEYPLVPSVVVSLRSSNPRVIATNNISTTGFTVHAWNLSAAAADEDWTFIAVEQL